MNFSMVGLPEHLQTTHKQQLDSCVGRLNTTFDPVFRALLDKIKNVTGININTFLTTAGISYLRTHDLDLGLNIEVVDKDQYEMDMAELKQFRILFEKCNPAKMEAITEERNNLQKENNKKDTIIARLEKRLNNKKDFGEYVHSTFVSGMSFEKLVHEFEGISTLTEQNTLLNKNMNKMPVDSNGLYIYSFLNLDLSDYVVISDNKHTYMTPNAIIIKKSESSEYLRKLKHTNTLNTELTKRDLQIINRRGITAELYCAINKLDNEIMTIYNTHLRNHSNVSEYLKLTQISEIKSFEELNTRLGEINDWLRRKGFENLQL